MQSNNPPLGDIFGATNLWKLQAPLFNKSPFRPTFFLKLAYEACRCFVVRKLLFVKKQVTSLKHLIPAATKAIKDKRVITHSNTN